MNAWERILSDPEVDRSQTYPVPCKRGLSVVSLNPLFSPFVSQIFGGNGYNSEYPVEKLMRDAKIFTVGRSS